MMNHIKDNRVYKFLFDNVLIIFLIMLCGILGIVKPLFVSSQNITNVLIQVAINALLATGMTFVILSGGIDLSVGSIAAFSGVFAAFLIRHLGESATLGSVILVVLGVCLATSLVAGLFAGLCISKLNVAPFIATLALLSVGRGFAYIVSGGKPIFELPQQFKWLGQYRLFGVLPVLVILMVVIMVIAHFVINRTAYGRHLLAVGSNEHVAFLSGINVNRIKMSVYIISAFMAALGGIILASKLGTGQPNAAEGYELDAIAAVVLGGTSMNGGKGGMGKTIIGVLTIGVINNGMSLLLVDAYWQKVIMGMIILFAVILDQYRLRNK